MLRRAFAGRVEKPGFPRLRDVCLLPTDCFLAMRFWSRPKKYSNDPMSAAETRHVKRARRKSCWDVRNTGVFKIRTLCRIPDCWKQSWKLLKFENARRQTMRWIYRTYVCFGADSVDCFTLGLAMGDTSKDHERKNKECGTAPPMLLLNEIKNSTLAKSYSYMYEAFLLNIVQQNYTITDCAFPYWNFFDSWARAIS